MLCFTIRIVKALGVFHSCDQSGVVENFSSLGGNSNVLHAITSGNGICPLNCGCCTWDFSDTMTSDIGLCETCELNSSSVLRDPVPKTGSSPKRLKNAKQTVSFSVQSARLSICLQIHCGTSALGAKVLQSRPMLKPPRQVATA